jgi:hypothetical protein
LVIVILYWSVVCCGMRVRNVRIRKNVTNSENWRPYKPQQLV